MIQEDIERTFYDKHQNYSPSLRIHDNEGNEIKLWEVIYDYHTHLTNLNETIKTLCAGCRTQNFCQNNFDKPCKIIK